jgi:hypothetical protein
VLAQSAIDSGQARVLDDVTRRRPASDLPAPRQDEKRDAREEHKAGSRPPY